jgi:hypothetical protein
VTTGGLVLALAGVVVLVVGGWLRGSLVFVRVLNEREEQKS